MFKTLTIATLALAMTALGGFAGDEASARLRGAPAWQAAAVEAGPDAREAAPEVAQSRRRLDRRGWRPRTIDRDRDARRHRQFSPRGYRYNRRGDTNGRVLPMRVVASRALACHPGRILDARLQGSTYVFKILTRQGRLVRVYGNARTGSVSCR